MKKMKIIFLGLILCCAIFGNDIEAQNKQVIFQTLTSWSYTIDVSIVNPLVASIKSYGSGPGQVSYFPTYPNYSSMNVAMYITVHCNTSGSHVITIHGGAGYEKTISFNGTDKSYMLIDTIPLSLTNSSTNFVNIDVQ